MSPRLLREPDEMNRSIRFASCLSFFAAMTCSAAQAKSESTLPATHRSPHTLIHTTISDIPILLSLPDSVQRDTRLIVFFHGFGPPGSPDELAAAISLDGTPFIGVYVNLPMIAKRIPAGGIDELRRLQQSDFVNGLYFRSISQSVAELSTVVRFTQEKYGLDSARGIGLFGFSAGGSAALLALTESNVRIAALVAVNAPLSVRQNVAVWERELHQTFVWDEKSTQVAKRFDVLAHAEDIARRSAQPSLLFLQGDRDEHLAVQPVRDVVAELKKRYGANEEKVELHVLQGASHNFGVSAKKDDRQPIGDGSAIRRDTIAWFQAQLGV